MIETYDLRPDEACIVNCTDHRQPVTTRLYLDPRGRPFPLGLEPRTVYVIPTAFGGRQAAVEIDRENRPRVQLEEGARRGAIPIVFSTTNMAEVARWLGRGSEPSFAERVVETSKRYELPNQLVAASVCRLVGGGFDEDEAVRLARETYARELARQRVYWFNWGGWANGLIEARRQALARAGEGRV